jgi:hypothetical protein
MSVRKYYTIISTSRKDIGPKARSWILHRIIHVIVKFYGLETPASFRNGRCFFGGYPLSPLCQYLRLSHIILLVCFKKSFYSTGVALLRFSGCFGHRLGVGNLPALLGR